MQNGAKLAVRVIAGILILSLVAGLVVMAVSAAEDTNYQQLTADVDGLVIDRDTVLDLNGYDAVNVTVSEGVTLQLIDSANDTYEADKCGSLSGTIHGTVEQLVKYDSKNYLVIEENGVYSAHRFYAGITGISLVPGQAALGYKAVFKADAVINAMVTGYGYRLQVNDLKAKTYLKDGSIQDEVLTLRVYNILSDNETLSQLGATATIYGNAIICFTVNGETLTVEGAEHNTTLCQAVEAVNAALGNDRNAYTATQVQAVRDLYDQYAQYMTGWQVEYIFTEDKFIPVENVTATYGDALTLGRVFTAVEGVTVGETVTVTVNGEEIAVSETWADTALSLTAGDHVITITDNDRCWTATNTVVIAKADPSYELPTGLTATYGDTLADVDLPEGFSWVDSTASVGNAGTQTHTATYNAGENYNPVEVTVTVEVAKADTTAPAVDTLNATYGQMLSEIALPEGFSWVDASAYVGNAGTQTHTAIYNAGENYNTVEVTVTVEVAKADTTAPAVDTLNATYGQMLSEIALPEGFSWVDSTASVGNAGTNSFAAIYNAGENYNPVEVTVTVEVAKIDPTYTIPAGLEATEGDALSTVTLPDGFTWDDGDEIVSLDKAEYAATYTNGDANYNTVKVNIPVAVKEKPVVITDKFAQKMPEAAFVYRLGNGNTVALSSIFAAVEGAEIDAASVNVTVTAVDGAAVSGAFTANTSDWTKGTLKFTGTGVVNVTIKDGTSNEFTLTFEIVNAKNATSATSATANNVVLLNDCGFSSASVGNGYTLFGNGFTMTSTSEAYADSMSDCYLKLENGTLDNVRIVVPFFANGFLYVSQASNESAVASPYEKNYYNLRSAVYMTGESKIANSYISGGRAAVYAPSGNPVLENTTIYGGSAANIHVGAVHSLTMKDMTLIQRPVEGTANGENAKTAMGFSVLFEIAADGAAPVLNLEGYLDQFAWVNSTYKDYVPDGADKVVDVVLKQEKFLHDISVDGVSNSKWMNLGFAYFPYETGTTVNNPTINDNRTNQTEMPYAKQSISVLGSTAYVYSIQNENAHDVNTPAEPAIQNNAATLPQVSFTDSGDGKTIETGFDATDGWHSKVTVDLDTTGDYTFSFDDLVVSKYGKALPYTVEGLSGNTVTLNDSGVHTYTLHITDNVDCNVSNTVDYIFVLTATKTSIAEPEVVANPSGTALLLVKSKDSDWTVGVPALEGTQIKYWNKTNGAYATLSLSSLVPTSTGKQNGTKNYWEYTEANGNYTLKITCGVIHDTKGVYGMPVVVNNSGNKMYFTISSTTGYVSTNTASRSVTLTYEFTDGNGQTITFSKNWSCTRANMGTQYSYSDFCNGTLKEASSGSSCVTGDTLVTLADGTQKQIKDVTYADQLLVWDFYKGEYAVVPAAIIFDHGYDNNTVIKLKFSDGTCVNVVNLHQFMDANENKFVTIDAETVAQYVGHAFVKRDGSGYKTVTLESYTVSEEYVEAYGIITAGHYNVIVNGMWSTDFMWEDYDLFNYFAIGENMMFDQEAMAADIAAYGLYTYEDFADYLTYEQFVGFNVQFFKISVGKGLYTYEGILNLIATYLGV